MSAADSAIAREIVLSPFGELLGMRIEAAAANRVRVRLPFANHVTTLADVVHGGAIAALVDTAATAAIWSGVERPEVHRGTTIGFSVSYLAAARGEDLVAEARVLRRGGSVSVLDVQVTGEDGELRACATVTYKLSRAQR